MDPTSAAIAAGTQFVAAGPGGFQTLVFAVAFIVVGVWIFSKLFENSQSNNAQIRRLKEDFDYQLKRAQDSDARADAAEQRLNEFINGQLGLREELGQMRSEVASLRRDNEKLVKRVEELTTQNEQLTDKIQQYMETRTK